MSIARRVAWMVCVLVCCAGCDRVAKSFAQAHLDEQAMRSYLADTVRVQLRYNEGAFLSLGASLPKPWREAVRRGGVACVLLGLLAYVVFFAPSHPLLLAGAGFVFAGGASNLLDRFLYDGRVVDFLSVGIINLALLKYKGEVGSGLKDAANFVGGHHFGFQVDDLEAAKKRAEAAGGKFFFTLGKTKEDANFEVKYKDPDGVIFDISEKGWIGTSK